MQWPVGSNITMKHKKIFNLISYLRFPFYLWGFYFFIQFILIARSGNNPWEQVNNLFVLTGIGLAFASLKDSTKNPTNLSKWIWKNNTLSILVIMLISLLIGGLVLLGLSILFFSKTYRSESVAVGMIVLGLGLIGYLKYVAERIEYLN